MAARQRDDGEIRVNAGGFAPALDPNLRRPGYPYDLYVVFDDAVRDTGIILGAQPSNAETTNVARFQVFARTPQGDVRLRFRFRDLKQGALAKDGTLNQAAEYIEVETYQPGDPTPRPTWRLTLDPASLAGLVKPRLGDVYRLDVQPPLTVDDVFTFTTAGQRVNGAAATADWQRKPYVVPNPYVGAASFEPQRFASSGRGERRMEFRSIPQGGWCASTRCTATSCGRSGRTGRWTVTCRGTCERGTTSTWPRGCTSTTSRRPGSAPTSASSR